MSQTSSARVGEHVSILPLPLCHTPMSSLYDGVLLSEEVCTPSILLGLDGLRRNCQRSILTALFSSSLAGDEEGGVGFVERGRRVEGVVSMEEEVVKVLLCVGQVLVDRGVGLLACQKCIHPTLRDYLYQQVRLMNIHST